MADRRLTLTAEVELAIRRHGEETYPHECCGALVGRDGVVSACVPLPNTTEEGPRRRFLVRPSDYRDAERKSDPAEHVIVSETRRQHRSDYTEWKRAKRDLERIEKQMQALGRIVGARQTQAAGLRDRRQR